MVDIENVIIIGGGPAGLSAAIYLARADLNPLVFAGSPPGGQLTLTSEVENYPGYSSIMGPDLILKMREHALKFGVRIIDENVLKVDFSKKPLKIFGNWKMGIEAGQEDRKKKIEKKHPTSINQLPNPFPNPQSNFMSTKSVIIATGAKALWLNLPSETRLRGKGVSACATCDGFFFREKTVAVIGGGDTALEEALTLTKFAKKIYIIHRRHEFRASKIMQDRVLKNPKIEVIWDSAVEEILGEKKVEGIKLRKMGIEAGQEDRKRKMEKNTPTSINQLPNPLPRQSSSLQLILDGVFVAIGHKPDTDLFTAQVEMDKKGYILTSNRVAIENLDIESRLWREKIPKFDISYASQTSVQSVFAAGDCVDHVYRQAATAVGMGVAAALEVEKYLETTS